jgi:hypothetical protein
MTLTHTGCIDEVTPTTVATPEQIAASSSALQSMMNALPAFFMKYDTYGSSGNTNDWGYPCQMFMREVQGEDFPVYENSYNYWSYLENASSLRYMYYYSFYYYYKFIKNANNVIKTVDPDDATESALNILGVAYGFRAFCYLDLFRLYEYKLTGYPVLDDEAKSRDVVGLTVSIVTEQTTSDELKNNPRAPFYTMNRFVMSDLNKAEKYLKGYTRTMKSVIDLSVVYGLKARLYLDMATRFDKDADALSKQLAAENADDGYDALGIKSAADCYQKAAEYARLAISSGYQPLTEDQWTDPTTGFNTVQPSWMLSAMATSKEQVNTSYYWNNFITQIGSEATWTMGQYSQTYRCISKALYDQISDKDWRKNSWVAPGDCGEGVTEIPSKYKTLLDIKTWNNMVPYANIKFRAGNGSITSIDEGLICSLPVMRVEEMYFTEMEAMAHTQGVAVAASALQSFINTYRYTDGSYRCEAKDMTSFINELMLQRRIEFWGEGVNYFDYKRLGLAVTRAYDDTNYLKAFRLNSKDGYVAPWMNYVVPETEKDSNSAVVLNPDPSGVVVAQ